MMQTSGDSSAEADSQRHCPCTRTICNNRKEKATQNSVRNKQKEVFIYTQAYKTTPDDTWLLTWLIISEHTLESKSKLTRS